MNTLPVSFTRPGADLPTRAHPTDAGLDLHAAETTQVAPRVVTLVPTGIAVAIPAGHGPGRIPGPSRRRPCRTRSRHHEGDDR